ncbi:MAG: serine protease, partial [Verrucomicrobiota bacterium]
MKNWIFIFAGLHLGLISTVAAPDLYASVVKIHTTYNKYDFRQPWQSRGRDSRVGSGCIIDNQRILTAAHIVGDATFIRVRLAGRADKVPATVEFVSHARDLALLKVDDERFFENTRPLALGGLPQVGQRVTVCGYPGRSPQPTMTKGIVSGLRRKTY